MRIAREFNKSSFNYQNPLIFLGIILTIVLASISGQVGLNILLWVIAPLAILIVTRRPVWGVFLIAITIPLERLVVLEGDITFTRLLGIAVFSIWIVRKIMMQESWQELLGNRTIQIAFAFLLFSITSIGWAVYPEDTLTPLFSLLQQILWALLILDLVNSFKIADHLAKILVLASIVTSVLTIEQYFTGQAQVEALDRAGQGITGGINSTAMVIVTIMPLAFYLIRGTRSTGWKMAGWLSLAVGSIAVLTTASRASFILMAILAIFELRQFVNLRISWSILLILLLVGGGAFVLSQEAISGRLMNTGSEFMATISALLDGGPDVEGGERGYLMRVGIEIFKDYPFLGSGYENFRRLYIDYQLIVPGATGFINIPRSPHNSYIGILSNLGLIGLGLWLGVLISAWTSVRNGLALLEKMDAPFRTALVRAFSYSLGLQIAYGLVRPVEREKILWLFLGIALIALKLANEVRLTRNVEVEARTRNMKEYGYPLAG